MRTECAKSSLNSGLSIGVRSRRSGQSGIFIVLNLTTIFAIMGLAADVGMGYLAREQAQTAADAAVSAAATYAANNGFTCGTSGVVCGSATPCAYPNVTSPTNNLQVGCLYAAANGFVNTGNQTVSLTANASSTTPPPGVTGNSPAYWVQANVSTKTNTLFGLFAKVGTFNINSVAAAGVTTTPPGACIYVIASGNVSSAFSAAGGSTVTASGCGIFVASTSSSAFYATGGAKVTASQIVVTGGSSIGGGASASPTPVSGSVSDPLANLPMPTFSGCDHTNYSVGNGNSASLTHGVYCGGISISGGSAVTLGAGTYVLNGGGLSVSNGATLTSSGGVTFFNTGQSGYTVAAISTGGGANLNLSAPTTGTYQGILFVQDRNLTYSTANTFSNGSSSNMTGTLYFPTTSLSYGGGANQTYMAIVAKTVSFSNGTSVKADTTGTYTGLASHGASLIY
jgi:hypothetical protein